MSRWAHAIARAAIPLCLTPLTLVAAPAVASTGHAAMQSSHIVVTDRGVVKGAATAGVERFLGIPYAAAPTGALRWKAPRPAAPWTGVRNASTFGNACPVLPSTNGPRSETEDCLVINVWRPVGVTASSRRPVHVFIHGGGLVNGSGAQNDESRWYGRPASSESPSTTGSACSASCVHRGWRPRVTTPETTASSTSRRPCAGCSATSRRSADCPRRSRSTVSRPEAGRSAATWSLPAPAVCSRRP